jgi:hypothetical protein
VQPEPQRERGVFIINEGLFPNAGSIGFYNITKDSVIQSVVATSAGWITPNDGKVAGNKLYVVVNGGNKVYVRNAETFQPIDSIAMPANSSPGYIWLVDSTKAYVANYNGTVSVLDLNQRIVVRTSSSVVSFPGGIAVGSGRIYVSDFGFYPNLKNRVKVLDPISLAIVDSVRVGVGAGSMVAFGSRIYVVSSGSFPANGAVYAISTSSNAVEDSVMVGVGPTDIAFYRQSLYVLHSDRVMKLFAQSPMAVADSSFIPISNAIFFYAMQVDDVTGDIFLSRITSSAGSGEVAIYSSAGALRRPAFGAGVFPGAFAFK